MHMNISLPQAPVCLHCRDLCIICTCLCHRGLSCTLYCLDNRPCGALGLFYMTEACDALWLVCTAKACAAPEVVCTTSKRLDLYIGSLCISCWGSTASTQQVNGLQMDVSTQQRPVQLLEVPTSRHTGLSCTWTKEACAAPGFIYTTEPCAAIRLVYNSVACTAPGGVCTSNGNDIETKRNYASIIGVF